jgi:hypothetical protein
MSTSFVFQRMVDAHLVELDGLDVEPRAERLEVFLTDADDIGGASRQVARDLGQAMQGTVEQHDRFVDAAPTHVRPGIPDQLSREAHAESIRAGPGRKSAFVNFGYAGIDPG